MFTTLRNKLLIGLTPLLAIMVGLGIWAIVRLTIWESELTWSCVKTTKACSRHRGSRKRSSGMDSAAQFALNGEDQRGRNQFRENQPAFQKNLEKEQKTSRSRASRNWPTGSLPITPVHQASRGVFRHSL